VRDSGAPLLLLGMACPTNEERGTR
jgi:hypothetical protein